MFPISALRDSKLFISPPFGNYIEFKHPNIYSIKGSYTLDNRGGYIKLIWRIVKTLRYSFKHGGWQNKIGLCNKGIDWALDKYKDVDKFNESNVLSIAILNPNEISTFNEKIPKKINLEINISCKNTEHDLVCDGIEEFLNPQRKWCSIKLAPDTSIQLIDSYYQKGFRQFHCCNTLKKKELNGSLSGPILIPHISKLVRSIREKYDDVEIVAGGGIRNMCTLHKYQQLGASHYSVSTLIFNPILFYMFYSHWKSLLK